MGKKKTLLEKLRADLSGKDIAREWALNQHDMIAKYKATRGELFTAIGLLQQQVKFGYTPPVSAPDPVVVEKPAPKKKAGRPKKKK